MTCSIVLAARKLKQHSIRDLARTPVCIKACRMGHGGPHLKYQLLDRLRQEDCKSKTGQFSLNKIRTWNIASSVVEHSPTMCRALQATFQNKTKTTLGKQKGHGLMQKNQVHSWELLQSHKTWHTQTGSIHSLMRAEHPWPSSFPWAPPREVPSPPHATLGTSFPVQEALGSKPHLQQTCSNDTSYVKTRGWRLHPQACAGSQMVIPIRHLYIHSYSSIAGAKR